VAAPNIGDVVAERYEVLAVLGRGGGWSADAPQAPPDETDATLLVLPDPCLLAGPDSLADAFRDLPVALLACAGRHHPHLLPLYLWLRRCWSAARRDGTGASGSRVERTARALLDEAGIWISETGRYRAIEALKRDLEFMREQGWLGSWRLQRSELRDALEDRYRLHAPGAVDPRASALALPPGDLPGAEACMGS